MSDPRPSVAAMDMRAQGSGSHEPEAPTHPGPDEIVIDCGTCVVRGAACGDCVVSVLLGPVGAWDEEEQAAVAALAGSGLVPPLRLVREGAARADGEAGPSRRRIRGRRAG